MQWVEKEVDDKAAKKKHEEKLSEGELSEDEAETLKRLTSKLSDEERKVIEHMLAAKKKSKRKHRLLIQYHFN